MDYRPYKELEEVELDDRVLMLKAVGQHDREVADEFSVPEESVVEAERRMTALDQMMTISPSPTGGVGLYIRLYVHPFSCLHSPSAQYIHTVYM